MKRLYTLGDGHDVAVESKRLVNAAQAAIDELQRYLIRHGIDDLSLAEKKHFGTISSSQWSIDTPPASTEDLQLLLRMDRILQLSPERKGERRNDPRFHIGWQHFAAELERAGDRSSSESDPTVHRHIEKAKKSLASRRNALHPKMAAVSEAIRPIVDQGEKVLVFCHHRATATELLAKLEQTLKIESPSIANHPEDVWRTAWETVLSEFTVNDSDKLRLRAIIDWLCSAGIRRQVAGWLIGYNSTKKKLADLLSKTRPRKAGPGVPTIAELAKVLVRELLDTQSMSTRALLSNMATGKLVFGGKTSHFPGRLDDGLRVMGCWEHDGNEEPLGTLYTGKPDIVLALFNSPFGPDVLVATDRLSEGVDLHRCCRHLIHYELDSSPVRTLQRNGRIRRVGSWAALTKQPICYAYPTFGGTRDEKAVGIMRQRINAFGLLLGGVPSLDNDTDECELSFADAVLSCARKDLEKLNRKLAIKAR